MFLSIFKMMLNAERCPVLPSSTVLYLYPGNIRNLFDSFYFLVWIYTRKRLASGLNSHRTWNWIRILRPISWTKSRQKYWDFSSLLFKVTYTVFAMRFLFLQTHATSYSFYSSVTVHCKGERRKTWELSRLCPETSTKLYVHEFGFRLRCAYILVLLIVFQIRIHMFSGHPDPEPLVRGVDLAPDPDPSIIKQK